jgi:peptide deformylase
MAQRLTLRHDMILPIVQYGQPVLRQKGERIETITPEITELVVNMLETMRDADGIGLAAQQIGKALQLAVVDVAGLEERISTMEINGKPVVPDKHMPMILINPEIRLFGDSATGPEGCLSFPEIYGDITRPVSAEVRALNDKGEPLHFTCGGLLARAIQHEYDHLQGILFIDRMSREVKRKLQPELDALQAQTKARLGKG